MILEEKQGRSLTGIEEGGVQGKRCQVSEHRMAEAAAWSQWWAGSSFSWWGRISTMGVRSEDVEMGVELGARARTPKARQSQSEASFSKAHGSA